MNIKQKILVHSRLTSAQTEKQKTVNGKQSRNYNLNPVYQPTLYSLQYTAKFPTTQQTP